MLTEHLLYVRHLFKSWEVKILVLRSLFESRKRDQGALRCPEGSSQWLWALVAISVKEVGGTTGTPSRPLSQQSAMDVHLQHRGQSCNLDTRIQGTVEKTGTEKSTLGSEFGFQKQAVC